MCYDGESAAIAGELGSGCRNKDEEDEKECVDGRQ